MMRRWWLLAVKLAVWGQILFLNARVVEDYLVSLSSLFQSFRVVGKNDCPKAVFVVEMYL